LKFSIIINGFESGSPDDVEQVQFYAVYAQSGYEPGGCQHLPTGFTGKSQDDVGTDVDSPTLRGGHGLFETGDIMAPVYPFKGCVVGGLQAVLNPDKVVSSIAFQQIQNFSVDTVRSGPDGQPGDIRHRQGLIIKPLQVLYRGIGVGK